METDGDVINGEVRLGPTNAFEGLHISSSDFLNDVDERVICSTCHRSRKYFCYTCYMPMDTIKDKLPMVQLPVQIDIIKYPKEVDGKSTATHATILAPDKTSIYTYPNFPNIQDKSKVLVVFPGKNSVTLEDLAKTHNYQRHNAQCCRPCKATQDKVCDNTFQTPPAATVQQSQDIHYSHAVHNCKCSGILKISRDKQQLKMGNAASEQLLNSTLYINCNCSVVKSTNDEVVTIRKLCPESTHSNFEGKCSIHADDAADIHSIIENVTSEFSMLRMLDHPTLEYFAELFPYERIIFIDSTWNQVHKINNDERLDGIQRVEIKSRDSLFWRYQRGKPRTYLATIEAIYYFLVDVHVTFLNVPYNGEYDNLLFFFRFMYDKIHRLYGHRPLRAYSKNATKNPPHKMARLF